MSSSKTRIASDWGSHPLYLIISPLKDNQIQRIAGAILVFIRICLFIFLIGHLHSHYANESC